MSNAALNHVWKYSKAKGSALLVMIAIADMANDEGDCWPGRTSLANKCRMTERYLQKLTAGLTGTGELEIFVNDGKQTGTGKTNRYRVTGVNGDSPLVDQRGEQLDTPGVNGDSSLEQEGVNGDSSPGVNHSSPDPSDSDPSSKNDPSFDPSSSEALQPGEVPNPPTPQVDDDELLKLIQPEIQKLHLNPQKRDELLALGPLKALAIAWNAQEGHTPAGLAVKLMGNGGPAETFIERARMAIQLRTLEAETIDRYLRYGDMTALSAAVEARQDHEEIVVPLEGPEQPIRKLSENRTGILPRAILAKFDERLKTLLVRPPGEWVFSIRPLSFADGMLTVNTSAPVDEVRAAFEGAGFEIALSQALIEG